MGRTFIKHVRIVDGTGAPAIEDGLYVFNNKPDVFGEDVVEYAGEYNEEWMAKAAASDNVMDLSNGTYTMLPGLFNVHVHPDLVLPYENRGHDYDPLGPQYRTLLAYRRAAEALNAGVTTIRTVGTADACDVYVRNAIKHHMFMGPNMVTCGREIIAHAGHGYSSYGAMACSGVDEFTRAARLQCDEGVDQLKLMFTGGMAGEKEGLNDFQMRDEEVEAVIWVAHAANKKTCAHLSNDKAIYKSVMLGLDCVEHGYTLSKETAELMAERGTYYTPTLSVSHCEDYLVSLGSPRHQVEKGREAGRTHTKAVQYAHEAGVKICVGTDLLPSDPIDGTIATIYEMELLHKEGGLSPMEVITAATYNGACMCGLDKVTGSLKAGLMGDFIIAEGKPDENLSDIRNIKLVAKDCRLVWGELPGANVRRFNIIGPGYKMEGGVFNNYGRKGRF